MRQAVFAGESQYFTAAYRFGTAVLVVLAFFAAQLALGAIVRRVQRRSPPEKQDALNLIWQAGRLALWSVGAVTALGTLGINVTALVAGLGLTGFALGFALKDALSNLLAGVLLLMYRPFTRGSRISVSGFEGEVTEIDLRYTTLQANDRKVLIPNANLFSNPVSILETGRKSSGP